ncbi:NnrU family protein [Roseovarius sp. 2305UL8-3]|uniref:NnrU family protein n=1 Tax=Roseovarius conchicola TaxID=3121636 RepID=UPI0035287367
MLILIAGVALWAGAHLFKRLAPERREAMGDKGRGIVALVLLVSIVLMVLGYKAADTAVLWGRHPATVGINNLLMLLAIYLFAVSAAKTALARKIRHPQLTAFKTWAIAHLLVNGDIASIVLFGGLLAWAVVEVIVINRANRDWTPPDPVPTSKEISAIVITLVVYAVVVGLHYWAGYPTFG